MKQFAKELKKETASDKKAEALLAQYKEMGPTLEWPCILAA